MRNPDPCVQLEILDKSYITTRQIYQLIPGISLKRARQIYKDVLYKLVSEGYNIIPGLVPVRYVTDMYPLDRKGIERAVKRKTASV